MKEVKLSAKDVKTIYDQSSDVVKSFLEEKVGKEVFVSANIMDKIKTFQAAYAALPKKDEAIVVYDKLVKAGIAGDTLAYRKLVIIIKALNEGWTPDWTDSSQNKYYCWFKASASGVGFSYHAYVYAWTNTGVGSRLVFRSSELATFAGKQFESIYNEYLSL